MRIAIVLGTRPEIIKMAPIVRALERRGLDYFILHTGQHRSYEMSGIFFEQLGLPRPKHNLGICSGARTWEVGRMLAGIERVLRRERPGAALVEGDTNTTLAGALAACKLGVRVGHVEAGLRCYEWGMPEEINRVLADHVSDYLFAPTEGAKRNLLREGVDEGGSSSPGTRWLTPCCRASSG